MPSAATCFLAEARTIRRRLTEGPAHPSLASGGLALSASCLEDGCGTCPEVSGGSLAGSAVLLVLWYKRLPSWSFRVFGVWCLVCGVGQLLFVIATAGGH
jgi:hypothetical protein